jgi:glycosyltransferase involved in cell wall biosynthesis
MPAAPGIRRRILYFSHTRQVSGAERMLLLMLAMLDKTRYEAIVGCPTEGVGNLDELVNSAGVRLIAVPALRARFTSNPRLLMQYLQSAAGAVGAFRRAIRKAKPDLIHANSVRAGLVATLATVGMGVPLLWHVQDDLPRHPISTIIRLLAVSSRRTRFAAVSKSARAAFTGRFPFDDRVILLHNAIDRERFPAKSHPPDEAAEAFRSELKLGKDAFLVAAVGMINPRKGSMPLIEQFAKAATADARLHLAIVGAPIFNDDHRYEAKLKQRAKSLGLESRIHFTGARGDVPAILRAADLFVLYAIAEPFGLAILEAMSSGTPVIATEVGGIPEIVEDGVSGELVPSPEFTAGLNIDRLSVLIRAAAGDPNRMQRLADKALSDVLPRFSMERFGRELNAIYGRIFGWNGAEHG